MGIGNYLRRKSKTVKARDYYAKQQVFKSGVKNLPQSGLSALDRKSKGHQWNKVKDSKGKLTKWEAWNWVTKEMIKVHGLK